jgi:diguanylate cyclase (GGDEF)-like protein/PAS domain S-box-containing protein
MITQDDILNARILVVDDQEVNVTLLVYLLTNTGYTNVMSVRDPFQVEALHREHAFDLILLDLHMPGMSGFDVMEVLRPLEQETWLPVLVVTAEPDKKIKALEAGARDFISKPFDAVEVLTRIRNMLEVRLLHRESLNYGAMLERTVQERTAELQRFRTAMDATADAIFLIDTRTNKLIDASGGACRMLGYTRANLLRAGSAAIGLGSPGELHQQAAEAKLIRADQMTVPVEVTWLVRPMDGVPTMIAVARDISERLIAAQRLKHLAHYDRLTGLPNRTLFFQTLQDAIAIARDKRWRIAVLYMTLDRFKVINESLGAALGDELLRQFSNRLVQCVRVRDTVGRLGGDEFALILTMSPSQQNDAVEVAEQVRDMLRASFELDGHEAVLTASIGIAMYPEDATEAENLVKYADVAMARAREAGRDGYRFFTAGMNVQVVARLELELALRRALEHGEFLLHYQPKVNVVSGLIAGTEALLRWNRPGHGMVFPAEFVHVMEDTGLIVRVGDWIIDAACKQIARWRASGTGDVRVAVNISSRQFVEGDLENVVRQAVATHGIDPGLLELELTESALMNDAERTVQILDNIKRLGVTVSIDDFGTGYSSLAYLKRFPLDKLKIDIAFVRDVTVNPDDAAIAVAIINMAHSLHMKVVAEGVETMAQWSYLARQSCDEIQGFHFSRPLSPDDLSALVVYNRHAPVHAHVADMATPTILLVDGDVDSLSAVHRLLRADNYKILTAVSPADAFEQLALHPVQVVMSGQKLPGQDGQAFLDKVMAMYPGVVARFIEKPWDDLDLRHGVRAAFEQRAAPSH